MPSIRQDKCHECSRVVPTPFSNPLEKHFTWQDNNSTRCFWTSVICNAKHTLVLSYPIESVARFRFAFNRSSPDQGFVRSNLIYWSLVKLGTWNDWHLNGTRETESQYQARQFKLVDTYLVRHWIVGESYYYIIFLFYHRLCAEKINSDPKIRAHDLKRWRASRPLRRFA